MTEETTTTTTTEEQQAPCFVAHPDAGGRCGREAATKVHGLPFCQAHGAEARFGALLEERHVVDRFLEQFSDPGTVSPVEKVLLVGLEHRGDSQVWDGEHMDALTRAYPDPPEELRQQVRRWIADERPRYEEAVVDYLLRALELTNRLMRQAHEERLVFMVEELEKTRESLSAQAACALMEDEARE